jgi:hypothetical protein
LSHRSALERGGADLSERRMPTPLVTEHLDVVEQLTVIDNDQRRSDDRSSAWRYRRHLVTFHFLAADMGGHQ